MASVRYFAGAAEAAGTEAEEITATTLGELLAAVRSSHEARLSEVLERCSLLVDGEYADDPSTPLGATTTVDVLPPFAGG